MRALQGLFLIATVYLINAVPLFYSLVTYELGGKQIAGQGLLWTITPQALFFAMAVAVSAYVDGMGFLSSLARRRLRGSEIIYLISQFTLIGALLCVFIGVVYAYQAEAPVKFTATSYWTGLVLALATCVSAATLFVAVHARREADFQKERQADGD